MKIKSSLMSLFRESSLLYVIIAYYYYTTKSINNEITKSHTWFGVMWGRGGKERAEGTNLRGWHGKRLWFGWPLRASLVTSITALEMDKNIGKSTWSQYNNNKYADLSSLTYRQHYPALETCRSIGRSNLSVWPWKPRLFPLRWESQHRIGQDYRQVY